MKSAISVILTFMLLLCVSPAYCVGGDVSEIVNGNQDYLLLATVVDINDASIVLAPYHAIHMDKNSPSPSLKDNIEIEKFRYSYCDEHTDISMTPRVGDNVFISVNKNSKKYVMANGAYKISSVDHKMLTFYAADSMRESDCIADIVALANFVRTEGAMREFKLENGKLTTNIDNRAITLYPTDNIAEVITFVDYKGQVIESAKTKDVIIDGEKTVEDEDKNDYRWLISYGIILLGVLVGGVVVYNAAAKDILNRRDKRKEAN